MTVVSLDGRPIPNARLRTAPDKGPREWRYDLFGADGFLAGAVSGDEGRLAIPTGAHWIAITAPGFATAIETVASTMAPRRGATHSCRSSANRETP